MALSDCLVDDGEGAGALPIHFAEPATLARIVASLPAPARAYVDQAAYEAKPAQTLLLPGADGRIEAVLFGLGAKDALERAPFLPGRLATLLPPGLYRFADAPDNAALAALAFALGGYRFTRYKPGEPKPGPRLVVPVGSDGAMLRRLADAIAYGRDLINTPANDLGPEELAASAVELARRHEAAVELVSGTELERGFPLIHAVGKGSARPPRLVDFTWGDPAHAKVTLVGKGVVFDTGGVDLKTASGMLLMKKDMGGAASVLVLARLIMESGLKLRLRVLLPIVENAVSGASFRPGDVFTSRKGLSVEIGNTDAEGRLILADALALGDEEAPELMIDMATLTGAARVALGPDLPPFYTQDEALAARLAETAAATADPVWRMPLWRPYLGMLESKIADLNNSSSVPFAGSVTAALFLSRFVEAAKAWLHVDTYAWSPNGKPGRPEGGDIQGVRALFALLSERYPA